MRWPIQRQLLTPLLLVVFMTSVLSSGVSAWVGSHWARRDELDRLTRVVTTLTDASFPLQQTVLQKMTGLSGAEFVVWGPRQQIQSATLELDADARDLLTRIPEATPLSDLSRSVRVRIQGRGFLTARIPLRRAATHEASLLVLYPEDRWWTATRGAVLPPLIAGGIAAIVATVLATWWAQRLVRPIERLSQQSEEIANGVFQPMPLPSRDDELRDLTSSINRMVQRLAQYEQHVRRNEQLKTLGQLGAGLAHQLRNWLSGARLALQLHVRECPLGEASDSTQMALRQLGLMEAYLQRFLTLGAGRSNPSRAIEPREFSMNQLIDDVVSLITPQAKHWGVDLNWVPPSGLVSFVGDRDELQELLVNLLLNGLEAASRARFGDGATVATNLPPADAAWVRIELLTDESSTLRVRVLDSGPGPSESIASRLFEPFATDKPEGTGLGLAVAQQIAAAHNGCLRWSRHPTCFECELNRSPVQASVR